MRCSGMVDLTRWSGPIGQTWSTADRQLGRFGATHATRGERLGW